MLTIWIQRAVLAAALAACSTAGAVAQGPPPSPTAATATTPAPYAQYEFLIGEWEAGPADGSAVLFVNRFTWGPARTYIWQSVSILQNGRERLHFEGPMMWNAATRRLDYLFAIEPGTLGQEQGEVYIEDDGRIVRTVALTDANGQTGNFRQTITRTGPDTVTTSLMRQTADGWAANFPGSDRLVMRRRPTSH